MARAAAKVPENVAGDLYVDDSCIDCDTCTMVAPALFDSSPRGHSFVHTQPRTEAERRRALMALVSCPVSAIGLTHKAPAADVRAAARAFPEPVPGLPDVDFCGHASEDSYGASAWLIRRPEGNVLVDSPRASKPLLERLEELGGVSLMFLSHRDDVADHHVFARHFGCQRILHAADVTSDTAGVEVKLQGAEPVRLAGDLLAIPVPGHTRGSMALLYRDEVLFTGDHLWGDGDALDASRGVCWYSWPAQRASLIALRAHTFRWVLPGHGKPLGPAEDMHARLDCLLSRLQLRRGERGAAWR